MEFIQPYRHQQNANACLNDNIGTLQAEWSLHNRTDTSKMPMHVSMTTLAHYKLHGVYIIAQTLAKCQCISE